MHIITSCIVILPQIWQFRNKLWSFLKYCCKVKPLIKPNRPNLSSNHQRRHCLSDGLQWRYIYRNRSLVLLINLFYFTKNGFVACFIRRASWHIDKRLSTCISGDWRKLCCFSCSLGAHSLTGLILCSVLQYPGLYSCCEITAALMCNYLSPVLIWLQIYCHTLLCFK